MAEKIPGGDIGFSETMFQLTQFLPYDFGPGAQWLIETGRGFNTGSMRNGSCRTGRHRGRARRAASGAVLSPQWLEVLRWLRLGAGGGKPGATWATSCDHELGEWARFPLGSGV